LYDLFVKLGHKPALLKDVVKSMSADGIVDVKVGLQRYLAADRHVAGWRALLESLEPFDLAVLRVIAKGLPALGKHTLDELGTQTRDTVTQSKVRSAIDRLQRQGIVSKVDRGTLVIDDPLLGEYLAQSHKQG
jgi:hypothetical protein